jgi:membrane protease YdiL (CAAX protease family)
MQKPRVWPIFVTFVVVELSDPVIQLVIDLIRGGPEALRHPVAPDAAQLNLYGLAANLILVTSAWLVARPRTPARLRLVAGSARPLDFLVIAVGMVALGIVLDSAAMLMGLYKGAYLAFKKLVEGAPLAPLVGIFVVLGPVTGLAEELFFRGFMQTRLAERWRPRTALLVTSLCFGLAHLDPLASTEAFILGVWLGHATLRTGSLWPAVIAHATNNALTVLFNRLGLPTERVGPNVMEGAIGLALLALCLLALRRRPAPAALPLSAAS